MWFTSEHKLEYSIYRGAPDCPIFGETLGEALGVDFSMASCLQSKTFGLSKLLPSTSRLLPREATAL